MIKKILKIQNVGRFKTFPPAGTNTGHWNQELPRAVLIYGENGTGKTTLAQVFKSLQSGNADVNKKKSFSATANCEVVFLVDGCTGQVRFDGNGWNQACENIEIFDAHFISENVYTGHEIGSEQEKNLFELVVGKLGVRLKSVIAGIKETIKQNNKDIAEAKRSITAKVGSALTPEKFVRLVPADDLETQVRQNDVDLAKAKNLATIRQTATLNPILPLEPAHSPDRVRRVFDFTIERISEEYERLLADHKAHFTGSADPEAWLAYGWQNAQGEGAQCPFCQQPVGEHLAIIKAYSLYFNDKYARLISELDRMQQSFAAEKAQALVAAVLQVDRTNTALMQFWRPYVAAPAPTATALLDAMQTALTDRTADLLQDIEAKKQDPSRKVELTNADAYDQTLAALNLLVADYNNAVALVNAAITATKSEDSPTETQLLAKQQELNLQVLRKSEEMDSFCEDLLTHTNLLNANNAQLKAKQEKLDEYAQGTLAKYGERINHYLNKFAGYIQITVPKHKYIGSGLDPFVKYKLMVHDTDIALKESGDGSPSLKHSLSEGDKSALALSFFLAKLDLDEAVGEKVVVFDDPMSSFDASRKRDTIAVLAELSKNAKQLIVLTHNLFFAKDLLHQLGQNGGNVPCISLEIKHSGAGSMWREHEIDEEVMHRFLGDYRRLADYVENLPTLDEHQKISLVRCIRPVLEGYFRYKFVRNLGKTEWLKNALDKIRNAPDSTSPFWRLRDQLGTLEDLNDYSKGFHHADLNPADAIDEAQLLRFARRTLDVVQHI